MKKRKVCAVCGDTCEINVKRTWRRDKDGNCYSVCCYCSEMGYVNADSVENFKGGFLGTAEELGINDEKKKEVKKEKGIYTCYNAVIAKRMSRGR